MGILRGVGLDSIEPLVKTFVSSGLKTIEITMNTPGAPNLIRRAVKASKGRLTVGAGTVLSKSDFKKATNSGASFIVMPTLLRDVVDLALKKKLPVFPGALTPREIHDAWKAGATMVKVFPAKFFGPSYFKEIKGPFPNIKLLACGGVTPTNIKSFFECGASGVMFGASIFKKEWIKRRHFYRIGECIEGLISASGLKK